MTPQPLEPPDEPKYAWACECGTAAQQPKDRRSHARQGLRHHQQRNCSLDDPEGWVVNLDDKDNHASWVQRVLS